MGTWAGQETEPVVWGGTCFFWNTNTCVLRQSVFSVIDLKLEHFILSIHFDWYWHVVFKLLEQQLTLALERLTDMALDTKIKNCPGSEMRSSNVPAEAPSLSSVPHGFVLSHRYRNVYTLCSYPPSFQRHMSPRKHVSVFHWPLSPGLNLTARSPRQALPASGPSRVSVPGNRNHYSPLLDYPLLKQQRPAKLWFCSLGTQWQQPSPTWHRTC